MLNYAVIDTGGDSLVDNNDSISSGVSFIDGIPSLSFITPTGTEKGVNDTSGKLTIIKEKGGGGSRRIMWRQIQ
jgi:type IV pilus assembly protein PilY1